MKAGRHFLLLCLLAWACPSSSFAGAVVSYEKDGQLTEIEFSWLEYQWSENAKGEPVLTLRHWLGISHPGESWRKLELSFRGGLYDEHHENWRFSTDLKWRPERDALVKSGLFRALPSDLDLGAFSDIRLIDFVSYGDEDLIAGVQRTNRLVAFSFASDVYLEINFHPEVGRATLSLKLK